MSDEVNEEQDGEAGEAQEQPEAAPADVEDARTLADLKTSEFSALIEGAFSRALTRLDPAGRLGAHVNSGPPGFVNSGGHANFDPKSAFDTRLDPGAARGAHVNSGPPGFVNSGGHANFDPKSAFDTRLDPGAARGAHVNSGPPGFVNSGGHANFDPKIDFQGLERVQLPDGGVVTLPPGRVDITIRGFRIQR